MSVTIDDIINKVSSLDFKDILQNTLIDKEAELTKLQREQMIIGVDSKAKKIGKYKNKEYARKKNMMNPRPGFGYKDLKLTGDFHHAFIVEPRENEIVFSSADPKMNEIVEREGERIFGLHQGSISQFTEEHLQQAATEKIIKHIHG